MVDPRKMHQIEPDSSLVLHLQKFRNSSRTWLSDLAKDKRIIMSPQYVNAMSEEVLILVIIYAGNTRRAPK